MENGAKTVKKPFLELVGVQLTNGRAAHLYHIDNIYRISVDGSLTATVIQKGYDMPLNERFEAVCDKVGDAYAPVLRARWEQSGSHVDRVYLQFGDDDLPLIVGLMGRWRQTAER